ncbi:MAG: N-acetyl sugar amidotransferase [Chloroflexi bacterium]|nr:N-acetyl sugar amidotransferase [Chloroflexota bacterium]
MNDQQICSRCIYDTSIPDIRFDEKGICNFCHVHDTLDKRFPLDDTGKRELEKLISKIKEEGKNKEYDCIVGVSGGRDSTYTLYLAKKLGLRPLAVHFDNGWNSETAVSNIKNATNKLGVDLHTVVANWEEFKDLQKAFLRASVSDAEVPTDYAIISVLFQAAAEVGVRYALNGHSFRTEGLVPKEWTYMDGRYIRSVHKRFGNLRITSFPIMSLTHLIYYALIKRITFVQFLQYFDYRQKEAMELLERELDWKFYGGHHHESVYTNFFQSYFLPTKFNIDKRKLEYSALIRSGQMTREAALKEVQENPYPYDKEVVRYTIAKLGLNENEFEDIMTAKRKTFRDYPTYYPLIKASKIPIKIACTLNLLPDIFYQKYFK